MDSARPEKKRKVTRRKRPVGRPPKQEGQGRKKRIFRNPRRVNYSWSERTQDYVKMVTQGKGAPCKIWSYLEKKHLLAGLKKFSHQDWDSLCKLVPSRSKEEIQEYIYQLKGGEQYKYRGSQNIQLSWAPVESWLDQSMEMVHYEQADLSSSLSRVFSIIGHFSKFPECRQPSLEPDYGKLYRYIGAVMDESLAMPDLTQLESAIIADLMHGLGDKLRVSDTTLQRKVMCWKYKMLNHKFDFSDVRSSLDRIRKALTNDFSDLQRDSNRSVSHLPSFNQTAAGSTSQGTTSGQAAGSGDAAPAVNSPHTSSSLPVPESPSALPQTAGYAPAASTSQSEQPTTSENSEPTASTSGTADQNLSPQTSSRADASDTEDAPAAKKRGRHRIFDWRRPIEKPRLFSMNPFCVPIRLLRLKPLLTAGPSRQQSMSESSGVPDQPGNSKQQRSEKAIREAIQVSANREEERSNIRQVTGLYKPTPFQRRKREGSHTTMFSGKTQISSKTMDAVKAALAQRKLAAPSTSSSQPVGSSQPQTARISQSQAQNESVISLPSGQKVVQVANRGNNSNSVPTHAFRYVQLPDGKMALVPMSMTKAQVGQSAAEMRTQHSLPRQSSIPNAQAAFSQVGGAAFIGSPEFRSPLRAPVIGCSVSVGTSDDEDSHAKVTNHAHGKSQMSTKSKTSLQRQSSSTSHQQSARTGQLRSPSPSDQASRSSSQTEFRHNPEVDEPLPMESSPPPQLADPMTSNTQKSTTSAQVNPRSSAQEGRSKRQRLDSVHQARSEIQKQASGTSTSATATRKVSGSIGQKRELNGNSQQSDVQHTNLSSSLQRIGAQAQAESEPDEEGATQPGEAEQQAVQSLQSEQISTQLKPMQQNTAQISTQLKPMQQNTTQISTQLKPMQQNTTQISTQLKPMQQNTAQISTQLKPIQQNTAQSQPAVQRAVQPRPGEETQSQPVNPQKTPAPPQPQTAKRKRSAVRSVSSEEVTQVETYKLSDSLEMVIKPLATHRTRPKTKTAQSESSNPSKELMFTKARTRVRSLSLDQPTAASVTQSLSLDQPIAASVTQSRTADPATTQPQPIKQRAAPPQSHPAQQRKPSVVRSVLSEEVTQVETYKLSDSLEMVIKPLVSTRSHPVSSAQTKTAQSESGSQSKELTPSKARTGARSVSVDEPEIALPNTSAPRSGGRSRSVERPSVAQNSGPVITRAVARPSSSKIASLTRQGKAVVIRTLSQNKHCRSSAADWSAKPEPFADSKLIQSNESGRERLSSGEDGSPTVMFSRPLKTYSRVPCYQEMGDIPQRVKGKGQNQVQTSRQKSSQQMDIVQKMPHLLSGSQKTGQSVNHLQRVPLMPNASETVSQPTAVGQSTSQCTISQNISPSGTQTKATKSSFKTILAQVASPHATFSRQNSSPGQQALENTPKESGQGTLSDELTTEPSASPPHSPSSSSSPSPPKKLKLTKKFLTKRESTDAPQETAVAGGEETGQSKKGRKKKKEDKEPTYIKAKRRPASFLLHEDISHMQVEYVTVEDSKKRMAKVGQTKSDEGHTQRGKDFTGVGTKPLTVVVDDEELSLVSI